MRSLERSELHIHSGTNIVAQVLCVGDQPVSHHCSLLMNTGTARLGRCLPGQVLHTDTKALEQPWERAARGCLTPCKEQTHLPKKCPKVSDLGRASGEQAWLGLQQSLTQELTSEAGSQVGLSLGI